MDRTTTYWSHYTQETDPTIKRMYYNIAATPIAQWFQGKTGDGDRLTAMYTSADAAGQNLAIVLYAIPDRDCGSLSSGGLPDDASYRAWIDELSNAVGSHRTVVIVEPDAISFCNNTRAQRTALLTYVGQTFHRSNPNAALYIHAGSGQLDVVKTAQDLKDSGIQYMRGFAMNVSSHGSTASQETYGDRMVAQLASIGVPNMRYVVDTGRNGIGNPPNHGAPYGSCNNFNAALGTRPTSNTDDPLADAYLWIKGAGASDGTCHTGDPSAGKWFPELAQAVVQNSIAHHTIDYWPLPAT